jgi:hypothetical protein
MASGAATVRSEGRDTQEAAIMAPGKEGGRTRREGNAGRTAEKETGQGGGATVVDADPWGSFFEKFWERPVEGEGVDRHEGGRKPAKGTRTTRTRLGR